MIYSAEVSGLEFGPLEAMVELKQTGEGIV